MKSTMRLIQHFCFAVIITLLVSQITVKTSRAHDYTVRELTIDHPWARPTPGGSKIAAFYFKLVNTSNEADTLVSATSNIGKKIEIHETKMTEGVAKMRRLEGGVPVGANKTVALEPAGLHLMVMGLTRPLQVGDRIPLTLTFQNRGSVKVKVNVEKAPAGTNPVPKKPAHHH